MLAIDAWAKGNSKFGLCIARKSIANQRRDAMSEVGFRFRRREKNFSNYPFVKTFAFDVAPQFIKMSQLFNRTSGSLLAQISLGHRVLAYLTDYVDLRRKLLISVYVGRLRDNLLYLWRALIVFYFLHSKKNSGIERRVLEPMFHGSCFSMWKISPYGWRIRYPKSQLTQISSPFQTKRWRIFLFAFRFFFFLSGIKF